MNFYKTQKLLFFISFIFLPGLSFSNICPEWVEGNPILQIKPYWEEVGSEEIIKCLKEGQDLSVRDEMGRTPLHLAALYSKKPKVIKLLIQGGSKIGHHYIVPSLIKMKILLNYF